MPSVLVTRATFPDIARRLREHFDVEDNPNDNLWDPAELRRRLQGRQGVMPEHSTAKWWRVTTITCHPARRKWHEECR